jgi:hypothetical protein
MTLPEIECEQSRLVFKGSAGWRRRSFIFVNSSILLVTYLRSPLYVLRLGRIENFGNETVETRNRERVKAYCARINE